LTGKKSDSLPSLSKADRERLTAELAYHEEAAARLESQGNTKTYHHEAATRIRAALAQSEQDEVKDGKLD